MMRDIPLPRLDMLMLACSDALSDLRLALHLPVGLENAFIDPDSGPPIRLLRLVGNLPDDGWEHGAEPDVLIRRLLRLALVSVHLYQERCAEPRADSERHAEWVRRLCAICLAGLVRDLGVVWFIDVRAGSACWPIHCNLIDWSAAIAASDVRIANLQVTARRTPRDLHHGPRPPNLYFLSRIVTPPVIRLLGWQSANDIVPQLGGCGPAPDHGLTMIDEAHLICSRTIRTQARPRPTSGPVAVSPTTTPPSVTVSGPVHPPHDLSYQRAHAFIAAFRRLMSHLDAPPVNHLDAEVFVSASHTLILLAEPPESHLIRRLLDRMQTGVGAVSESGMDHGPCTWRDMEQALANSTAPSGHPLCLGIPATLASDLAHRTIAVIADRSGPEIRRCACLIFDNQVLWDSPASDRIPCFTGRIEFYRPSSGAAPAKTDTYGFTALDLSSEPTGIIAPQVSSTGLRAHPDQSLSQLVDRCLAHINVARRRRVAARTACAPRSARPPPPDAPTGPPVR